MGTRPLFTQVFYVPMFYLSSTVQKQLIDLQLFIEMKSFIFLVYRVQYIWNCSYTQLVLCVLGNNMHQNTHL